MKLKTCFNLFTATLSICIFLTCCKKGDTGPAGPAGPAGPTGAAGAAGPKGDTGTANVIYSAWLDVAYLADTIHSGTIIDTLGFYANITAPKLTNAILTNGEMKVYVNLGTSASPNVVPLPYNDIINFGVSIMPQFYAQRIFLYSNAIASTYTEGGAKYLQYRYILIPGSVPARMMQKVNLNNYNEVKEFYNLLD